MRRVWLMPGPGAGLTTAFAVVVASLAACERDPATAPRPESEQPTPAGPLFDPNPTPLPPPDVGDVPGSFQTTVGIESLWGDVPGRQIGSLPRRMVIKWRIKQHVTEYRPNGHTRVARPPGWLEANECHLSASMWTRDGNGYTIQNDKFKVPSCWQVADPLKEEYQEHKAVYGPVSVWVARKWGFRVVCDGGVPCHTYQGSTTWTVIPDKFTFQVTASASHVPWGTPVTFTASRSNGAALSKVEKWIWVPYGSSRPPRTVACATTSVTCTTPVYEDGWMFAQAVIDGYLETAYAGVTVAPPKVVLRASTTTPRYGEVVIYTASPDPTNAEPFTVTKWKFVPDDTAQAPTTPCANGNSCADTARTPGTMLVDATIDWATDSDSVRIRPYREFTLRADKSTVFSGDTVTFTPYMDGQPAPAARWRWEPAVADPSDVASCASGASECKKVITASGTMWAYVSGTPGGDSASASVTKKRRKLILTPSDTQYVEAHETVTFTAMAEGGGTLSNVVWSFEPDLSASMAPSSKGPVPSFSASSSSAVGASTCTSGVTSCWDEVLATYTRTVQATVDDSAQMASVPIRVVTFVTRPVDADESSAACDRFTDCTHQPLVAAQRSPLDSITDRMRTADSAYCRDARDSLRVILAENEVYTYLMDDGNWAQWRNRDTTRTQSHQRPTRHIDMHQRNWGSRGCVAFDPQQPANCSYRGANHLESVWVHEGLHAIRRTHPDGGDFPREMVQRCMQAGHTDWGDRPPRSP